MTGQADFEAAFFGAAFFGGLLRRSLVGALGLDAAPERLHEVEHLAAASPLFAAEGLLGVERVALLELGLDELPQLRPGSRR